MVNATPVYVGDTLYPSISAAARAHGLNLGTVLARLNKGCPPEDAFTRPKQTSGIAVTVEGVTYPSISAAARAYGRNMATVVTRRASGWSLERALKTPAGPPGRPFGNRQRPKEKPLT